MKLIGEILVEHGLLSPANLQNALDQQEKLEVHQPIGEVLISMGLLGIDTLVDFLDLQLQQD